MTKEEARRILAIFGAAYPSQFKNLDAVSVDLMSALWATQFANVPLNIITLAVSQEIAENKFAPTIAEIKKRLETIYLEAQVLEVEEAKGLRSLTAEDRAKVNMILRCCEPSNIKSGVLGLNIKNERKAIE